MKKLKMLTIVLVVILITMIAFGGIYIQKQNRMENIIKNYSYAMDLKGARNIRLKVNQENKTVIKDSEGKEVESSEDLTDDKIKEKGYTKEEIPYNSQESQKEENYKESKRIIEERLKSLKITDYNIKIDESTGDILLEIAENDNTDSIVSNIGTVGKFEIIDSETKEVLMDNKDIKLANVMYGSSNSSTTSSSSGTTVYLNIEFTKEGAKKLEDISSKYVKTSTSDNTTDNTDSSDTTTSSTEKKITMKIDDEEIMSTSFDETLKTGKIQLSIGKATTDSKTLQGYVSQASNIAVVLDSGKMPIKYDVDENVVRELRTITNSGVTVLVNNCDPNISEEMLCDYFGLYSNSVKVMSNAGVHMYKTLCEKTESCSAPAAFRSSQLTFISILNCASKIKKSNSVLSFIYALFCLLGILFMAYYSAVKGSTGDLQTALPLIGAASGTLISVLTFLITKP